MATFSGAHRAEFDKKRVRTALELLPRANLVNKPLILDDDDVVTPEPQHQRIRRKLFAELDEPVMEPFVLDAVLLDQGTVPYQGQLERSWEKFQYNINSDIIIHTVTPMMVMAKPVFYEDIPKIPQNFYETIIQGCPRGGVALYIIEKN